MVILSLYSGAQCCQYAYGIKESDVSDRWFYLLCLVVLAGFFFLMVREALRRQRMLKEGVQTQGKVVALHKRTHPEDGTSYFAEIAFVDAKGVQHQFESDDGSRFERPAVGTPVRVRYDPQAPNKAMLDNLGQGWGPTMMYWLIAFVMFVFMLGILTEMR
jgi:Protein of unknown function (DUF3592)